MDDYDEEIRRELESIREEESLKEEEQEEVLQVLERCANKVVNILKNFLKVESLNCIYDCKEWNKGWKRMCLDMMEMFNPHFLEMDCGKAAGSFAKFCMTEMQLDIAKLMVDWDEKEFEKLRGNGEAILEFYANGVSERMLDIHWLDYNNVKVE